MVRLSAFTSLVGKRPLGGREGEITVAADFDDEDPRINALFQ